MDRRTRNLFAVVLVIVLAVTGGAALILGGGSATPGPPSDAATVVGVVVGVDATSLTDVTGFTLRAEDGEVVDFGLTELQNGVAFPPGHLAEHQALGSSIRVWYDESLGGTFEALWLEDA